MFEILEKILQSEAGSFGFIFSILVLCFIIVWKLSHFTTKFSSIEKLERNIDTIKGDIHTIKAFIQVFKETNNPLAQRQSPVSMTPLGITASNDLNIKEMVINHWEDFNNDVIKHLKKECNPYDIQVESFKIGNEYQKYINEEELTKIKNHAFKAGYNLDTYNLLFGIIIRDKILNDRGHQSKDVDLFDPSKK